MGTDMEILKSRCYFKNQHVHGYKVRFKTYNEAKMSLKKVHKAVRALETSACYSQFWNRLDNSHTHLYTMLTQDKETKIVLTEKEVMNWLDLCKKYDLLPKTLKNEDCYCKDAKDIVWFKLNLFIYGRPQARVYMYIDSFRHLREDPGFIKAILYLHNECKINFYAAYVMSSHLNISGTGHHTLLISNTMYSSVNKPNVSGDTMNEKGAKMNLKAVRGLYIFIKQKKAFNDADRKICKNAGKWSCNDKLQAITAVDLVIPIKHITDPRVEAIINEVDDLKAKELYNKFIVEISDKKPECIKKVIKKVKRVKAKYSKKVKLINV